MKRIVFTLLTAVLLCISATSSATEHPLRIGFGADLGAPSGLAVGAVVHPKIDWVSVQASLTHNYLAFGGRLSVKVDPLALKPNLPIGLFADLQSGFATPGKVPGYESYPPVGYQYVNTYLGLRLGKPNNFHWLFEVGPTYITSSLEAYKILIPSKKGLTVGNPTVSAWITPTFSTGFEVVFP